MRLQRICHVALLALVLVFPMLGVGAVHHSAALFQDDEIAAKATVVELLWRNPHVLLYWDVTDDSGDVVRWVGEMASVTSVMADGLTRNSLQPGDEIIAVFRPARAGTPESVIGAILRPDGTFVLPWGRQGGGTGGTEEVRASRAANRVKLLESFGIRVIQ
jgi:hypothetical protein